jgi:hypothetical protein
MVDPEVADGRLYEWETANPDKFPSECDDVADDVVQIRLLFELRRSRGQGL